MQHHVEHMEMGIPLLKALCVLNQSLGCPPATLRAAAAVAEISDLEDGLMEQLLLLTLPDMLVIVRDLISVLFLPGVVALQRRVKQLVIDLLQILVDKNRSVSSSNTIDEDLSFDYERFIPVMHFVPISPRCDYCTGGARDYYFSAYIRYGMIADESVNIQAGYAHKTIGFGDISVGIDVNGTPSFSASVATVVPYVARAVTVTY